MGGGNSSLLNATSVAEMWNTSIQEQMTTCFTNGSCDQIIDLKGNNIKVIDLKVIQNCGAVATCATRVDIMNKVLSDIVNKMDALLTSKSGLFDLSFLGGSNYEMRLATLTSLYTSVIQKSVQKCGVETKNVQQFKYNGNDSIFQAILLDMNNQTAFNCLFDTTIANTIVNSIVNDTKAALHIENGLSLGEIIGIVIAVLIVIILIAVGVPLIIKHLQSAASKTMYDNNEGVTKKYVNIQQVQKK